MNASTRAKVKRATVSFPRRGGQGVIVAGGYIITAAHVVGWTGTGDMTLGREDYWEEFCLGGKETLRAQVLAAEPVADVAFLGCPDDQYDPDGAEIFETLIEGVAPISIYTNAIRVNAPFRVHILTHKGTWVTGEAQRYGRNPTAIAVHADDQIVGGTSGGPVVTNDGRLLGVVSSFNIANGIGKGVCTGPVPRPHLSAPVWLARQISSAGNGR